jgi:hypothetical protein
MGKRGDLYVAWARRLLWLYPPAWRARYADEVTLVLQQHRVTLWTLLDVLLGALDARLRRDLLPGRLTSMAHRIRTCEIAIFCAFVLFGIPWLALWQVRDPLPVWESVVRLHPEIRTAFVIVQAAGLVAFLAILAGGLPILFAALKHAFSARRWKLLLLFAVPFLALAALVGYGLLASPWWTRTQSSAPTFTLTPLAVALQLGLIVMFCLAVAGSTAAVGVAVARSELSERIVRLALVPAAVATLAIGVGLVATLALWALILAEATQLESPSAMTIAALVMLVAAGLAASALMRGLRAARAAAA